jgi:hypothetical protein
VDVSPSLKCIKINKILAERVGFDAALILKAVGISLEKFSWLDGKSKAENGSRSGSRVQANAGSTNSSTDISIPNFSFTNCAMAPRPG